MVTFSKYHGCGNDFIIISYEENKEASYAQLAKDLCHRNLGIGADGLIVVKDHPLEMIFYNRDGSRAPMCGNGIRCFAKYCYDEAICRDEFYRVKTLAGTMNISRVSEEPFMVEVNMGRPEFALDKLGIIGTEKDFIKRKLEINKGSIEVSSCFMGTIHTVVWLPDLDDYDIEGLGREISSHPIFTESTNVNMVQIIDRNKLILKTYERGVGMTHACGTGACASVVIGILEGICSKDVEVVLPYGNLYISEKNNGEVLMRGPAQRIGHGVFD